MRSGQGEQGPQLFPSGPHLLRLEAGTLAPGPLRTKSTAPPLLCHQEPVPQMSTPTCLNWMVMTMWDRLLLAFMLVEAVILIFDPCSISFSICA